MSKINIVLYHPEIPDNCANIMRTCVGIDAQLHLIKPLGFDLNLSEKVFKRASANYANLVNMKIYDNWQDFLTQNNDDNNQLCFITRYGKQPYNQIKAQKEQNKKLYLIFGSESSGIDKEILQTYQDHTYRIPTTDQVRSLNLANCVMTIAYHCLDQLDFLDLLTKEPHKKDYWES